MITIWFLERVDLEGVKIQDFKTFEVRPTWRSWSFRLEEPELQNFKSRVISSKNLETIKSCRSAWFIQDLYFKYCSRNKFFKIKIDLHDASREWSCDSQSVTWHSFGYITWLILDSIILLSNFKRGSWPSQFIISNNAKWKTVFFQKKILSNFLIEVFDNMSFSCPVSVKSLSVFSRSRNSKESDGNNWPWAGLWIGLSWMFLAIQCKWQRFFNCPIVIKPNDILFSMLSLLLKCFIFWCKCGIRK